MPIVGLAVVICLAVAVVVRARRASELTQLIATSTDYLDAQQAHTRQAYQLDQYPHFDYDQRRGEIVFSDSAGVPRVVARIQIVGDVSNKSDTWLWSWANPSIDSVLADAARQVQQFGAVHGLAPLRDSLWKATESDGWDMTAVTAKLTRAKGAYRSPDRSGAVFMVFTDVRWAVRADSIGHDCDSGCYETRVKRSGRGS